VGKKNKTLQIALQKLIKIRGKGLYYYLKQQKALNSCTALV
jgi:hypothetical protein